MAEPKSLKEIIKEEYKRCVLDPVHFMKKYCKIQHPQKGKIPSHLYQFQEKVLQEYFNVMLFRDLIERYKISQAAVLKFFCKRVIGTSAGEFSVNKIYNELKSQGYQRH